MEGIKLSQQDLSIQKDGLYINKNLKSPGMLLIFANWCGHCQRFKPTFNQLCRQLGNDFHCISIEDSELQQNEKLIKALDFKGYPTIKFFDQNGKIIGEYNDGDRSKRALLKYICKVYHHCIQWHN
jgi:thiol-disulfide isomerase/thioredoxin